MRLRPGPARAAWALSVLLCALVLAGGCGDDSNEEAQPSAGEAASSDRDVPQPGEGTNVQGVTLQGKQPVTERKPAPGPEELAKSSGDAAPECLPGYTLVRNDGRTSCESDDAVTSDPPAQVTDNAQRILNGTFQLAKEYAARILNTGGDPITYWYLIYGQDCTMVSSDTGRCLIYLWKATSATGYGAGGVDRAIWRENFLATHIGNNTYQTRIVQIDFIDPFRWECSDTPRANTPRCT